MDIKNIHSMMMDTSKKNTKKGEAPMWRTFTKEEAAVDEEAVNRVIEMYKKEREEKEVKKKEEKESVDESKSGEEWSAMSGELWDPLLDGEEGRSLGDSWGSW